MSTDVPVVPATTEPEITQPEKPLTLAEHREDFPQPEKPGTPKPNGTDTEKPRHRAKSQQASTDDVAAIAEQTKRLREAEDAVEIPRKAGESDRVYGIRKRAEIAELAKQAKQPKPAAPQPQAPALQPRTAVPVQAPSDFKEPAPTIEQFANTEDQYGNYQRALVKWELKKENFETTQAAQKQEFETAQAKHREEFVSYINTEQAAHDKRLGAFISANPDARQIMESAREMPLTIAMRAAMELHEQGPAMMISLAKAPDLADELFLLTAGKQIGDPRTDPLVAIVRRRLLQRVQAGTSGSAAPLRQTTVAPRPPNPERTVPQTPRVQSTTEPAGSLADHRSKFPVRH